MLLGTMTDAEVMKAFGRDMETVRGRAKHWSLEWDLLCKYNPPMSVFSKKIEIKIKGNGNEYLLVWTHTPGKQAPVGRYFAKVMVGSGTQWWEIYPHKDEACTVAYTFHFFDRYQQRMKVVGDIKHVLVHFATRNNNMIRIFRKGELAVYAVNEGIVLAQDKKERVVNATFVSYDMLGETQKAAYAKIKPFLDKIRKISDDAIESGVSPDRINQMLIIANREIMDQAEFFYDLYYQEEGVKIDVKDIEAPKNETIYIDPDFAKELEKFKV